MADYANAAGHGIQGGHVPMSAGNAAQLRESRAAARGEQAEAAAGAIAVEPKSPGEVSALQRFYNRTLDVISDTFRAKNFTFAGKAENSDQIMRRMSDLINGD